MEMAASRVWLARHLDTNRHSTSPTAIFLSARREAPHRCGVMEGGVRPAACRLTNLVSDVSNWLARSGEGHPTASLIWLGRRPEGPGAEPLGKDLAPLRTPTHLR